MLSLTQLKSLFGQKKMQDSLPVVIASDQSAIRVTVQSPAPIIGTVTVNQGTSPWVVSGTVAATQSGTWNINNISGIVSLPTGASTAALQVSGNASLSSIDSKLTNPLPISGTVSAAQSGVWTVGRTWSLSSGTDSVSSAQSGIWNINDISGTVSLPTGAATSALQTTGNASLASIDAKLTNPLPISGTITANQGTSPWVVSGSVGSTLDLNYGVVGANTLRTAAQIGNSTGAADFAAGNSGSQTLRVVVATDQLPIPVTQSGTWNINNISGTISLPTGAATEASLAKLTLTQGSTTSGQSGPLIQGAVSTAAPVYTNGQTSPLSLTTSGLLRVDISGSSATNQNVNLEQVAGTATSVNVGDSDAGTQRVVLANNQPQIAVRLNDGPQLDAFSRLRTSQPDTIFESNFRWSSQSELWSSSTATGGTATNTANTASMDLSVTTANGSTAIYQTKRYFPYNAGKSQYILMTCIVGSGQTNTRKRWGYFDSNDGLFFEQNGTTVAVIQRSSTSGVAVNTTVTQSSWNLDPLDGTGPSGYTLNLSNDNIYVIDFEWLGAGRVRMGVVIDGLIIYAHEFLNANNLTVPYMRQGVLPIRAEIVNLAAVGATSTIKLVCCSVMSEGGAQSYGVLQNHSRAFTLRTVNTAYTPVISIRLRSTTLASAVRLLKASGWVSTADSVEFAILINPTLTGSTFAAKTTTLVEADTAATTLTGGTELISNYIKSAAGSDSLLNFDNLSSALNTWLGSNLAGTADIFTLAARCQTGTADVAGVMSWLEMP